MGKLEVNAMKKTHSIAIVIVLLGVLLISGCNLIPGMARVKDGDTIEVNYTGKLSDGTVFDTSAGRSPIAFTLGDGRVIPGFEKAIVGMKVGEKKTVTIPASEAYGPHRDELVVEVPREKIPRDMIPEVGQQLQSKADNGSTIVATITKVSETTVTLDANHPLAGKDLTFEIELVKIQ